MIILKSLPSHLNKHFNSTPNCSNNSEVKEAVNIPVIVGSGVDIDNLGNYKDVDAIIIGSSLKVI